MKQQIFINESGELLLIDSPEHPKDQAIRLGAGGYDESALEAYNQALTSAIEKGIKFKEQRSIVELLTGFHDDLRIDSWAEGKKGQSFDLPNSYTADYETQVKITDGGWIQCSQERYEFGLRWIETHPTHEIGVRLVAVLTPLKQEEKECESSPNGKHKFGEYIEGAYRCCFCGEPGNEAKKESWISVEDQLPENDTWVIAYSKSAFRYSGQMVVLYSDETFYGHGMPLAKSEVTHWQPTLTPPL